MEEDSMNIRLSTLWKVPVYCIVTGFLAFNAAIYLISHFAIIQQDGEISSDPAKVLIIYGLIFAVTLFIGGFVLFRSLTRKEIFISASIVVVFGLVMHLIQWKFNLTTGSSAIFFIYVSRIFEWCRIVPQLLFNIIKNSLICNFIGCLTPYLFIMFGKKAISAKR